MEDKPQDPKAQKSWVEEIEVSGGQLVDKLKELLQQANTRRVTICKQNGEEIFSVPLTVGVLVGGIVTFSLPVLAAIGVIAGIATQLKLKVERQEGAGTQVHTEDKLD